MKMIAIDKLLMCKGEDTSVQGSIRQNTYEVILTYKELQGFYEKKIFQEGQRAQE